MEMVLTEGLMVTILGFSTVFLVLIFISIILAVFGKIANNASKTAKTDERSVKAVPAAPAKKAESTEDISELIAVITAAIVASEKEKGNTDIGPDKLVVRSLRKINSWNKETIYEQQHSSLL